MAKFDTRNAFRVMTSSGTYAELTEKLIMDRKDIENPDKIVRWINELRAYRKQKADEESKREKHVHKPGEPIKAPRKGLLEKIKGLVS